MSEDVSSRKCEILQANNLASVIYTYSHLFIFSFLDYSNVNIFLYKWECDNEHLSHCWIILMAFASISGVKK